MGSKAWLVSGFFFFQAEDGIRDWSVTGVQTCALPISELRARGEAWVAQRFVRQRPIATPWGDRFVTLGVYLLDGEFAGYFARLTPESRSEERRVGKECRGGWARDR